MGKNGIAFRGRVPLTAQPRPRSTRGGFVTFRRYDNAQRVLSVQENLLPISVWHCEGSAGNRFSLNMVVSVLYGVVNWLLYEVCVQFFFYRKKFVCRGWSNEKCIFLRIRFVLKCLGLEKLWKWFMFSCRYSKLYFNKNFLWYFCLTISLLRNLYTTRYFIIIFKILWENSNWAVFHWSYSNM